MFAGICDIDQQHFPLVNGFNMFQPIPEIPSGNCEIKKQNHPM
jgi:hypothetical protein